MTIRWTYSVLLYIDFNSLHTMLYYSDLKQSRTPIQELYDKYYELHKIKHIWKAVSREVFIYRIAKLWRSVQNSVRTPKPPKKRTDWLAHYRREYKWPKTSYNYFTIGVRNWMSREKAILPKSNPQKIR